MMSWLLGRKPGEPAQLAAVEKLRGYYDLAQEAIERAYQADTSGDSAQAVKLYRVAVQAMHEGLQVPAQGTGLSAAADNVSNWRQQLSAWQQQVNSRLRVLEAGGPGSTSSAPPVKPRLLLLQSSPPGRPAASSDSISQQQQQQQGGQQRRKGMVSEGGARANARPTSASISRPFTSNTRPTQAAQGPAQPAALRGGGKSGGGPQVAAAGAGVGVRGSLAEDDKYRQSIRAEMLVRAPSVKWDDIADLVAAKQALREAVVLPSLRPDLFSGPLRAPVRGILLYGPPGNGKTLLGKALAHEASAAFFSISASSLTSKWVGEGEKLMRALFSVAAEQAPSIIFIDEIDSIMSARGGANENDAARRLKTEFLVQFDGVASANNERVIVIGATNRPYDLDDAVRRRLVKRIHIPLPSAEGRAAIMKHLLKGQQVCSRLSAQDLRQVVKATEGYSASDLTALCKEAAMMPIRELSSVELAKVQAAALRAVTLSDFASALAVIKPSTNRDMLKSYTDFTNEFGSSGS